MLYPSLTSKGVLMAVFGVTWFLRYEKWGWTYNLSKTLPGDDPSQYTPSLQLVNAFKGCHSNFVVFERLRVANLDNPRLVKAFPLAATFGNAGSTIAHPNYSVVLNLVGANGSSRNLLMRGGLQTWPALDAATGQINIPGTARTAYETLIQEIENDALEIRQLEPTTVNPNRTITSITQSIQAPGFLSFTSIPDVNVNVGERVKIGRVDPLILPALNGEWEIIAKSLPFYTIAYKWLEGAEEVIVPETGQVRKASYQQRLINGGTIYKVSSRDTGRPFGLSRGRSKGVSARQ